MITIGGYANDVATATGWIDTELLNWAADLNKVKPVIENIEKILCQFINR